MIYGWIFAAVFLAGFAWLFVLNTRQRRTLRQERVHTLELQRELATTIKELSDVKTRRKRLLAASTQGLIIIERDYSVSSANKMAKQMFGPHRKRELSLIQWTRRHELQELVDSVLAGEKPPPLYFTLGHRYLEAHARSIKSHGDIIAVALAIQDVTELQRLSRARRDFVANISHELRTPLASTQLLLETLEKEHVFEDRGLQLEMIGKIKVQVEALQQMALELLDLSLLESGQMPLRLGTYCLAELADQQVRQLVPQAERKSIDLCVDIDDEIKVLADSKMVGRVILNLVHNAIKFTEKGNIRVTTYENGADGSEYPEDEYVTVAVSDTGAGIPPDEINRIFERFYKIDRARNEQGTGLGLAIARHVVEAHGGRIWAENNQSAGVTFFFDLPLEA